MKSLENVTGLQEMNVKEMNEINGGWANIVWYAIGILSSEFLDFNAGRDFSDGYNAARRSR